MRCCHESQCHKDNCFITLTYDDEHLPSDLSVDVVHWQNFARLLRKRMGSFRYFHCGEYGDKNLRPHYHAILFGLDFADKVRLKKNALGDWLFTSELLSSCWKKGFSTVGAASYRSAAYVARYAVKKATEPNSENPHVLEKQKRVFKRYERIDQETGEVFYVKPEYVTMSRRPGIGANWLERYESDVYPIDHVVLEGRVFRPPRFYDERVDENMMFDLKKKRFIKARENEHEYTPERLKEKEKALEINLKRLERRI